MENQTKDMKVLEGLPETEQNCADEGVARTHSRKRYVLLFAVLLCCAAILAGGTLAYFTAEETAYNVITTGVLSMDLREETTGGDPFPEGGISGIMPGQIVDKKVYVVNTGSVDFYARIAISKTIADSDGKTDTLNFKNITLDLNTADWTEKDGFYYYNRILKPGEKTEPLFTTVTFGTTLGNDYMNARIEIDVDAQAVQSRNNGDSALEAVGWAETK